MAAFEVEEPVTVRVQCTKCDRSERFPVAVALDGCCDNCGGSRRYVHEDTGAQLSVTLDSTFEVDGEETYLASILEANAEDEAVLEFLRDNVLPLAVGAECVYHGGAGGDFTFKRLD